MNKEQTMKLQRDLNTLRHARPPLVVDGIYGYATRAAVLAFQGVAGLVADGIAGPKTLSAIEVALNKPISGVKLKKMRLILSLGKLGEVYSRGLYELAEELNAISGVTATVDGYGMFYTNADDHATALAAAYRSGSLVGCIGHSMGADSAAKEAHLLNGMGIPVHLLGPIDPTPFGCPNIAPNVVECISFANTLMFQLGGHTITESATFSGKHVHRDLAMAHTYIDDDHGTVHKAYVDAVRRLMS